MTKRRKFLLVAFVLSLGLLFIQSLEFETRYQALVFLGVASFALSAWSLSEDLKGVEWASLLILPVLYPVSVGLFYFLLPEGFLSRVFILGLFGVGMYALLLTANIFSVAAIRTIQLLRAAHAVGFLVTLSTAFFLFDTILSFRLPFWANSLLVGAASFPLALHALWSVELTEARFSQRVLRFSFGIGLLLAELGLAVSFWPVTIPVGSLFLISMLYVVLGVTQQFLMEKLFRRTLYEYLGVGVVVFLTVVLLTRWG